MKQLRKLVRLSPGPPIFTFKNVSLARFLHHKFKTWETEINFVKAIRKVINNKFQQYLVWKFVTKICYLSIFFSMTTTDLLDDAISENKGLFEP